MLEDDDPNDASFRLGEIGAASPLARDDANLYGSWVSMIAMHSIEAALDHAISFRGLALGAAGHDQRSLDATPWNP